MFEKFDDLKAGDSVFVRSSNPKDSRLRLVLVEKVLSKNIRLAGLGLFSRADGIQGGPFLSSPQLQIVRMTPRSIEEYELGLLRLQIVQATGQLLNNPETTREQLESLLKFLK